LVTAAKEISNDSSHLYYRHFGGDGSLELSVFVFKTFLDGSLKGKETGGKAV
jgi:hypothetical protein